MSDHLPEYRISVTRSSDIWPWRWWWSVGHGVWCYSGMAFTQRGAVRAARRSVSRFKRDHLRQEQSLTWTEPA